MNTEQLPFPQQIAKSGAVGLFGKPPAFYEYQAQLDIHEIGLDMCATSVNSSLTGMDLEPNDLGPVVGLIYGSDDIQ